MKKVYFDYQFIIDSFDERKYGFNLESVNKQQYQIVYSPAHIEEIARGGRSNKLDINDYLSRLSKLTGDTEIIFGDSETYNVIEFISDRRDSAFFARENPSLCYKRVVKYIHKNDLSEEGQTQVFKRASKVYENLKGKKLEKKKIAIHTLDMKSKLREYDVYQILINKIVDTYLTGLAINMMLCDDINVNILPNSYFQEILANWLRILSFLRVNIYEYICNLMREENIYPYIRNNHHLIENIIDNTMKVLLEIGFYSESKNKVVSNLHDTTHCIYASYCDYFITRDKRLYEKIKVIYEFLSIPTEIIYADPKTDNLQFLK
ncbi:hypothetical protein EDC44_101169 [Cricetibacter osteomyelitidis]|uniref:PIN domain-containing protein n=1 Tax=Cricetibacter osteomyelitidis TaxID=1521931 RepID=A0A4R2T6N5_9PAST|nr:hypothetical protein [Cricetibacter osteomyelitidis]TCP97785.1 hypothetical protein EDC44_101169 [Cricetibacter osteomyelitidis]